MSLIASLLPASHVLLDLPAADKKGRVRAGRRAARGQDRGQAQRRSSTACSRASAWAPPAWARASPSRTGACKGCARRSGAFVRTRAPVEFEAPDERPVQSDLRAAGAGEIHRSAPGDPGELAQMFSDRELRARLCAAADSLDGPAPDRRLADARPVQSAAASARSTSCPQVSVAQLFKDNQQALQLPGSPAKSFTAAGLDTRRINQSNEGLIGHLNFYHPNWIQIFSQTEAAYFAAMGERRARAGAGAPARERPRLRDRERRRVGARRARCASASACSVPLIASPLPSLQIIWVIRTYLGRALAEFVTRHGVLLDVLGHGGAAHRGERGGQERAGAGVDHARRRAGRGRRGGALPHRPGDAGRPQPGAAARTFSRCAAWACSTSAPSSARPRCACART